MAAARGGGACSEAIRHARRRRRLWTAAPAFARSAELRLWPLHDFGRTPASCPAMPSTSTNRRRGATFLPRSRWRRSTGARRDVDCGACSRSDSADCTSRARVILGAGRCSPSWLACRCEPRSGRSRGSPTASPGHCVSKPRLERRSMQAQASSFSNAMRPSKLRTAAPLEACCERVARHRDSRIDTPAPTTSRCSG